MSIKGATDERIRSSYINEVDKVAVEMERVWGAGVLEKLVDDELSKKFRNAKLKFDKAINIKVDSLTFSKVANNMMKGYLALDKSARLSGHKPPTGEYWSAKSKNNKEFIIVKNDAEKDLVLRKLKNGILYTLEELAEILETLHEVNECKKIFKEAKVKRFEKPIPFDDPIPWE
jgi:hypothetical protein